MDDVAPAALAAFDRWRQQRARDKRLLESIRLKAEVGYPTLGRQDQSHAARVAADVALARCIGGGTFK